MTAVSEEMGQPLETVKAVNTTIFEFTDNFTTMMKQFCGLRTTRGRSIGVSTELLFLTIL
ncbi:MAG: hypothetical protein MCM46_06175 [Candidatus Manganitrophus sp. SB1]|nr:hypothetical protein [Candidatus Manganitrophus morganii]